LLIYKLWIRSLSQSGVENADVMRELEDMRLISLTVVVPTLKTQASREETLRDHTITMQISGDGVRHGRFVDKRMKLATQVHDLTTDNPNYGLDYEEVKQCIPRYTKIAATALIVAFGPGALEMERQLLANNLEARELVKREVSNNENLSTLGKFTNA